MPIYTECYLFRANQQHGKEGLSVTNKWFHEALRIVTHENPWWNRTQGRDHFFVFAGARGPHIFKDWQGRQMADVIPSFVSHPLQSETLIS